MICVGSQPPHSFGNSTRATRSQAMVSVSPRLFCTHTMRSPHVKPSASVAHTEVVQVETPQGGGGGDGDGGGPAPCVGSQPPHSFGNSTRPTCSQADDSVAPGWPITQMIRSPHVNPSASVDQTEAVHVGTPHCGVGEGDGALGESGGGATLGEGGCNCTSKRGSHPPHAIGYSSTATCLQAVYSSCWGEPGSVPWSHSIRAPHAYPPAIVAQTRASHVATPQRMGQGNDGGLGGTGGRGGR
mmetsp:Transcript_24617/g.67664  ORF Transcript_24617/g.67664 Transcript_24617/m.67664 type:complete len:242 (+) Transcript_24617:1757-2482(+)